MVLAHVVLPVVAAIVIVMALKMEAVVVMAMVAEEAMIELAVVGGGRSSGDAGDKGNRYIHYAESQL